MMVDTGWIEKYMRDIGLSPDKRRCISEKPVTPVTLDEIGGGVAAVAAGMGLALAILAVECLYHYIRSRYGNET